MYLVNYAGALGLFVLIAIVFDLTEKLDGFLKHSLGVSQVWNEYYVHFIPYYANLLSPLFVFIAVIFTGARLAQRNEIITLLNAGWSFGRISRPFLGAALLIGGLNYVLSNFVLPPSNRARIRFESQYLRDPGYSHTSTGTCRPLPVAWSIWNRIHTVIARVIDWRWIALLGAS